MLDKYKPENIKHLYNICAILVQRRRRWADVAQMSYKCFMLAGLYVSKIWADVAQMSYKCFIFAKNTALRVGVEKFTSIFQNGGCWPKYDTIMVECWYTGGPICYTLCALEPQQAAARDFLLSGSHQSSLMRIL